MIVTCSFEILVRHLPGLPDLLRRPCKGYTYDWLCDYLTKRKQQVVLNSESSSWTAVTSKFSQGSVLGPLLFSLAVNDLRSVARNPLVLFADDTKICHSIQSVEDYQLLQ